MKIALKLLKKANIFEVPEFHKRDVLEEKVLTIIPREEEPPLYEGTSMTHLPKSQLKRIYQVMLYIILKNMS